MFITVPGSEIFPSRIRGPKFSWIPDPDPHQRIEVIKFFFAKFSATRSGMFIPDPDPGFGS
jgi:hypothetical protein